MNLKKVPIPKSWIPSSMTIRSILQRLPSPIRKPSICFSLQFFADSRKVKEGLLEKVEGSTRKIRHVKAFFEAMKVLSGDGRFEEEYNRLYSTGKEANMQSVLEMLDEKTEARTGARDLKTLTQNLKKRDQSLTEKAAEELARSLLDMGKPSDETGHKDSAD